MNYRPFSKTGRMLVVTALALTTSAFALSPMLAQDATPEVQVEATVSERPHTITVIGVGSAYGEPNIAYIELGVELVDANLATAFTQTADTMTAVRQALLDLGIQAADLQTSGVSVYPEDRYNPQTGEATERVYRVRNTLRVTARDVSQIEAIINAGVNAGANSIYNLTFGLDNAADLEQTARLDAVTNARTRAEQLASALGVTIGDALIVNEVTLNTQQPLPYAGGMGGAGFDVASTMPVEQGQLGVTAQVQVTFQIN